MKTIHRAVLLLLLAAHTGTHAQTRNLKAEAAAGERRAAVCFACHNTHGVAEIPGVPNLAGQKRDYLENALRAYRDGHTRQNDIMNAMAGPLSDRDIVNISAYFSLQSR
jgi:cytochrome c553